MNDYFDNEDDLYELTSAEKKKNTLNVVRGLLYLVLAALVIITGAHAVMLVLSQTGSFAAGGEGAVGLVLTGIRVAFPLVVELAAVVAGLGFIQSRWRGSQKTVGLSIELVWLLFAAVNMITFFAVERGQALQAWQLYWVQYGLPLSALIAGSLTYLLVRADPDHARDQERAAAMERTSALRFRARQKALLSPAMARIEAQRAWMDAVRELQTAGYTDAQIRFMTQFTPELMFDGDGDGRPDVFGALPATERPQVIPLAQPAANSGVGNGAPGKPVGAPRDFS